MKTKTNIMHPQCRCVVFLLAVVAALWISAAPARAQSPAILLDIKSPATASPPNESLLTINDAGDLWIKGQLYDYAFQTTITLDPSTDYWTIRDATGKILLALEVYNRVTQASTGNLYTIGNLAGWQSNPDQTGALLRYTNPSDQIVLTMSPAGQILSAGTVVQRQTAAAYPTVPPLQNLTPSTPPTPLSFPLSEDEYASLESKIIPLPNPQGRLFYNPGDTWLGAEGDVTDISWRQRWDPAKTTLQAYGARIGSRFQNVFYGLFPGAGPWAYFSCGFCDEDGMVFRWDFLDNELWLAYMALNPFGEPTWVMGWSDGPNWTVSNMPALPAPLPTGRPESPVEISVSMSNNAAPNWDPGWGETVDLGTSAQSRLYIYSAEFDHPDASSIPRKDGDPPVNVRCRLVPQNTPGVNHVELTLSDPAVPTHKRILVGPSGPCISLMWDGKLYENGVSGTAYYTQASDISMSATVYWNVSNPQKVWETTENSFDDPKSSVALKTETVATLPTNRWRMELGVGEVVHLTLLTQSGDPIAWNKLGYGQLSATSGFTVDFTAHDRASSALVTATQGTNQCSVAFNVIEPSGVLFENGSEGQGWAPPVQQNMSISYSAKVFIQPDSVNFGNIEVYESAAQTIATGYYVSHPLDNHSANGPHAVSGSGWISGKGTPMGEDGQPGWLFEDDIAGGCDPPFSAGTATWPIDWSFSVGFWGSQKVIQTINQIYTIEAVGSEWRFTVEKGASGYYVQTGDGVLHPR
jgi:hypothetical protein